jgi:hypothetical protein
MIESITWYLKNTKETLPKFRENIYIYIIGNYEYISYILSLQFETVTTMKKSIFNIKLAQRLTMSDCQWKHYMNSESFDYWTEGFSVVKTKELSISFGNKTCLEAVNRFVRLILCKKNPISTHNVHFGRPRNKITGAIFIESVEFFIHNSKPCRVFGSSL